MEAAVARMEPDGRVNLGGTPKEATITLAERMEDCSRSGAEKAWPKDAAKASRKAAKKVSEPVLRRLATKRFGHAVGDRLDAMLSGIGDWERLAVVSDLIVTAAAGRI